MVVLFLTTSCKSQPDVALNNIAKLNNDEISIINKIMDNLDFPYKENRLILIKREFKTGKDDIRDIKKLLSTTDYIKTNISGIDEKIIENFLKMNIDLYYFDNETELNFEFQIYEDYMEENKEKLEYMNTIFRENAVDNREYLLNEAEKLNLKSTIEFSFSRIGFNNDNTKALIYYGFIDGIFGFGNYLLLEKKNKNWVPANELLAWIK
jgi:hypothetical protein